MYFTGQDCRLVYFLWGFFCFLFFICIIIQIVDLLCHFPLFLKKKTKRGPLNQITNNLGLIHLFRSQSRAQLCFIAFGGLFIGTFFLLSM